MVKELGSTLFGSSEADAKTHTRYATLKASISETANAAATCASSTSETIKNPTESPMKSKCNYSCASKM